MTLKNPIELGYAEKAEDIEILTSAFFPSKVGGVPVCVLISFNMIYNKL